MPLPREDLARIARLRKLFLDETRGAARLSDYWRDAADLAIYDQVLAARIGWKWDAALAESSERGFARADSATVLDFGCGSGIAARRFAAQFGAREVLYHDRSAAAVEYAVAAMTAELPSVAVKGVSTVAGLEPDVLLVSHVLGELDDRGTSALRALVERSRRVVIVEPGNKATSRRLSALRDEVLGAFRVVAPCPHANSCPALASERDWCHFFAPPPPEVFTDGEWVRTARAVGVDLRSLPYSFIALDREPVAVEAPPHRVLGRPDIKAREAVVRVCNELEVSAVAVGKREDPTMFRALKKHPETVRTIPGPR